jgi:acetyl esterase/lipase
MVPGPICKTAQAVALVLCTALGAQALAVDAGGQPDGQRGRGRGAGRSGASEALPQGTAVHRDLAYVSGGHDLQKLDLYIPKSRGPVPLVIFVHGGAFRGGDKRDQSPRRFLQDGYAFASLNYRLSQDAIFPAQIEDCKAAVRWLRSHAATYGLDPDRFGAWGTSAGGHLVAMLGTTGETHVFDVGENLDVSSRVQAVADWFGPTDFLQMDAHKLPNGMGHNAPGSPESRLIGGALQQNKDKAMRANPITYITPSAPPFLIAHGDGDRLVPHHQSELLEAALKKAGVPVTFYTVKGGSHGFRSETADQMLAAFFKKHLKTGH